MKDFLNKLNGWQRLFVAFLVFIYIPLSIAIINAQANVPRPTVEKLADILEKGNLPKIPNGEVVLRKDGWESAPIVGRQYQNLNYGYGWDVDVSVPDSVPKNEANKAFESVDKVLSSYYSKELWLSRLTIATFLTIIAVILYAIGWTFGWIYRGFKSQGTKT